MKFVKTNYGGYEKDPITGAVINNNLNELITYRSQIAQFKELSEMKDKYNNLEQLVKRLLESNENNSTS